MAKDMVKVTSRWAHGAEITGVAYTPDGSYVVTCAEEFTMHLFPQKEGNLDSSADKIETDEPVTCIVVTQGYIFTGSSDCMVRKYDLETQEHSILVRYDLKIRCLAISPDETLLAVGTESTEIRIVNMEDPEKCWSFKGHKKAVNSLSFDPLGEFLISSSCDGTVIVWNLKSKDTSPVETIPVMSPTTTDSNVKIPVAWHPSNEYFVIGKDKDIAAHHRLTWKKSFTYRTGSSDAVQCLAWSANGKYLSASSTNAELWIWQYKEKERPLLTHKHKNGGITDIAWAPNANRLVFTDTAGELSRWEDVISPEKGLPFDKPKPDPLAGLFDEAAVEDHGIEDQEMAQEYLSDNESLKDFIVDDDNSAYLQKKPAPNSLKPTLKSFSAKELHPRFQPGSTSLRDERRYLAFNLLGLITSVNHGTHATVSVEFHDKVAHRGYHFTDNFNYSMACLGLTGALFAAASAGETPSTVFYKTYDSWVTKSEWQISLPEGEDATAIALNAESAIVATSRGFIRVFSQSGIQTALFSVGSVVAAAGKDDMVLLIYHQGEPFQGSQNLGYSIYNVETGQRIQQGSVPVSDNIFIKWLGFSEGGIPAYFDSKGVLYILNYYRRVDQGQWTAIADTTLVETDSDQSPHYWPIGFTDGELSCIKCRRGETEPSFPKPFVAELPLKMPTLYQDTPAGQHEEAWLRQKILSGLNKDEKIAMSIERTDNGAAKKELEMDKLALRMIDLACKAERTQKALDLTAMLCNLKSIDLAVEIARIHSLHSLMERMNKVKEIKMIEEEDRDPNADLDLIMANPTLAVSTTRNQEVYKVSTREEDRELERKTLQRKEPIKPNDPFGRRVVKDSNKSTTAQNGASAGSATSNPFKKKGGPSAMGPSKGFGSIVEIDKAAKPITERASDLFEAADCLAADEQRARAQKEQSRQDDLFKKRKANNTVAGAGSATVGGQKTLSMFNRPALSSSTADAKRFKKQQDDEDRDMDMIMDADDFLEETRQDDDGNEIESQVSVRIPATQESEYLEESIEETRGHLEKTRVASSLSPTRNTSSILAGFKFNGS
ncbi:hypothetical protein BGZ80_010757 [Entomortierella chlamydospora]|uniref:Minichromosome loss protein Mcl1 middle region domain-containing protein n=1 Tax=Entomortierella chlamydospora TaxID=101097 RepID=A0A9P6MV79_9FUNG|nr:hypothetical protein BGZ79_006014 [Entomortierella chlamydospora]KAG0013935.1 hypothetical protein BGZ80_010757 [Entomortierella chlamydospora]